MGKKKQIRNLELEIERLRKNVITLESSIDKLLSDTITDQEKNVIKYDRQFAKATSAEFDKYLLSDKTPDYSKVSEVIRTGTFTPTDKQKADVEAYQNNFNLYNKEARIEKAIFVNKSSADNGDNYVPKMMYRHTEEGDKIFGKLSGHPVTLHKIPNDNCVSKSATEKLEMMTIHAPVGSFIVPPTDNQIINNHLAVIQEELQNEMDENIWNNICKKKYDKIKVSTKQETEKGVLQSFINLGDKFVKEVEYDGDSIKTKITYTDTESAPKTMVDINNDVNFVKKIAIMPKCSITNEERNNLPKTIKSLSKIDKFRYNDFTGLIIFKDIIGNWRLGSEILAEDTVVLMWVQGTISPLFTVEKPITLKDVNIWGHNVGDVTFEKSELLDGEPQECVQKKEEVGCKTSEKWLAEIPSEYKVKITDPDGWDRSNFEYSFKAECINKKEFIKRLMYSSIICHVSFWVSDWVNK